jgi:membrane protease YdiL (CAAX protease family)
VNSQSAKPNVTADKAAPTWKLVGVFYLIACGFSWLVWVPLIMGPDGLKMLRTAVSFPVFVSLGTLGPLLACFIVHHWDTGNWRAVQLLPPRPYQWCWLVLGPLLIVFSRVFVFSALFTDGSPATWHWHIGALAGIWIPMLNYNLFGGPLFEEFGWRGFLQSRLQRTLPPWIAAVVTGILWAIWHLPLFVMGWGGVSFPLFLFILVGVSLIIAFAFNASGQVIFVSILMHSAFNAANRFLPDFLRNVPTRQYFSEGLLIALSFFLMALLLVIMTRGRMLYRQTQ